MEKIIILKQKMEMKKEEIIKYVNLIYKFHSYLLFLFLQGGMEIDINKAMKDCEGIEKVQERTNTGVVSCLY